MTIILRFFPNGELSQGVDTSQRPRHNHNSQLRRVDKPIDKNTQRCYAEYQSCSPTPGVSFETPGYLFDNNKGGLYTYLYKDSSDTHHLAFECEDYVLENVCVAYPLGRFIVEGGLSPLGLSDARILDRPLSSRKKLLSMTSNMGRNIRNAVYLLEQTYGKEQLSFLTLTLPDLSTEGLALCCSNWDRMVNLFFKWLRKVLANKILELEYVYCTEIQPGRLNKRGEYAPHLHVVFRGKAYKKQSWAVTWLDCRNAWADIITRFTSESFDTRALENIQRIKKSAARYLSKYLSKGKQTIPKSEDGTEPIQQLHTQWGGMSRSLSRLVKKLTVRLAGVEPSSLGQIFYDSRHDLLKEGLIIYWSSRFISTSRDQDSPDTRGITVGVGCLSKPTYEGGLLECLDYLKNTICKDRVDRYQLAS